MARNDEDPIDETIESFLKNWKRKVLIAPLR